MNYCSRCDIAFEEKFCPLCEANQTIKSHENEIISLDRKIEELQKES